MGTSGSGKTTALRYLDAAYRKLFPGMRHYIFDSKFDGDFDDWPGRVQQDRAPGRPDSNDRYQVWQPVRIDPNEVERWLWMIGHNGPGVLEIDELVHLCYGKNAYSDEYNDILKTGRSKKIGVITLTQELSRIPPNAYKQSNHRLGFYIEGEYDIRIRSNLLKWKVDQPKDWHGFFYQHINGRGEPRYYRDIQSFLGVSAQK